MKDGWESSGEMRWIYLDSAERHLHLSTNLAILNHISKKDEEANSYRPTIVCGIHHG